MGKKENLMDEAENLKIRYKTALIVTIIAFIIICIISVLLKVFSVNAFPSNFLGAVLGALIGAIITFVLLMGQSDLEEDKRKNIRIVKMKTKIFKKFINSVWKVLGEQIFTIEKYEKLTSKYYKNVMIYLKDKSKLEVIEDALTEMGSLIDKTTNEDNKKVRDNIIKIINILSKDIGLGGEINPTIMDKHDEIVFPIRLRKNLLSKLNEALGVNDNNSDFLKGKYESIWEGRHCEFITFKLKKYPGIKLAIGETSVKDNKLSMVFIADPAIQQINEFRNKVDGKRYWKRLYQQVCVYDPINKDEDDAIIPPLDFLNKDSMKEFKKNPNYPVILSNRVLYYINKWKDEWEINDIKFNGYIDFFDKCLKQENQ
jgi:hypothetical protein